MAKKSKQAKKTVAKATVQIPKVSVKAQQSSTLLPLGDRVVVRPLSEEEAGTRSPSGIIIPDTVSKEKPEQGVVVAVGPGKIDDGERIPVGVSVGDRVLFSKYGYDEVKIGGKEYFIVSESGILAVINE